MTAPEGCSGLDAMAPDAAVAELAPLFEGAPRFLERLVAARPFGAWEVLFERARTIAHAMPQPEQIELVDAHPRLGAPREAVSVLSAREQGYDAGAAPSPRAVTATLADLNAAYEARFGFRYCVLVAGRSLSALVPELEAALGRDRAAELHRAVDAVVDIARTRHAAGSHRAVT